MQDGGPYLLTFWGRDAEKVRTATSLKSGDSYFEWFDSDEQRQQRVFELELYRSCGYALVVEAREQGSHTKLRTIYIGVYAYAGKQWILHQDFGYGYPLASAEFMFTDGNYACDCNVTIFLHEQYPDASEFAGEPKCGSNIKLITFVVGQL